MKPGCRVFLSIFTSFISLVVFAQQPEQPILFSNGNFSTGVNISRRSFQKRDISPAVFGNQYFVVIQFNVLPSKDVRDNLKKAGIELHSYIPGKAYLATISANFNFGTAATFNISSINALPSFYKVDPNIAAYNTAVTKHDQKMIAVSLYPSVDKSTAVQQLRDAGASIITTKFDQPNLVFIEVDQAVINAIAQLPFVSNLQLQSITDKPLVYNSVAAHGVSGLNALNGKNLNGKGVTIGIGDNAGDLNTHIDFSGRFINRSPTMPSLHGTHVAGIAAGAGIRYVNYHGMAPKATIVTQLFSDIITNAPTHITDNNMVITNNSYYSADDNCPGEGAYDALSSYADNQMGQYRQLIHVIASGNDGGLVCSPFPASYGTIKSGWQCAKNVLTVGAMNSANYGIGNFSSRGPVKDGRLKPEITAAGVSVISTIESNNYVPVTGTSMASPTVSGSLALMYERYRQLHGGANPQAALIKTLACNTAEDLGNAGPDFTYGFGMLNARRAVEALEGNRYFVAAVSNGNSNSHNITVPVNTRRLKIMLYWADTAAATNAAISLVNDLDLTVREPSSLSHLPLILNPAPGNVTNIAVEGVDHLNNIEQVVIENPAPGNYTIQVNGYAVPFGPEEYVISYEIVQPSIVVEFPFGGEKMVPGEQENIRWSAYGAETNDFSIEYSENNGTTWNTINANVPAASRIYSWTVPMGLITNQALIRVSRNGTSLTDQSDFNFTVLGSPNLSASNICEGAIGLDWSMVSGATSYDILQLNGDTMKIIGNTTSTSWIVTGLAKDKTAWLGVAAKNGTESGRRSVSVSLIPGAGACTNSLFNNDLKVDSILEPTSARQGFSDAGNAIKPVKILIRNLGTLPISGPMNVSFSYAGTTVTEIVNASIGAKGSYIYVFSGTYPILAGGFRYNLKSWVSLPADQNYLNDTAYKTVRYINNDAITTLPLTEGFESMPIIDFLKPELAIGDNDRLDFSSGSSRGRARAFVNTGFALSGVKALTLDQAPFSNTTNADSVTISYNLSNYAAKQLRFDFFYKNHGQQNAAGNKVWVRGSENDAWVEAYNLFSNQGALGSWKRALININQVLDNALPAQNITQTFQVRIGQEGNTSANTPNPLADVDDGYTIDNLQLTEALNDVGLIKIVSPGNLGCSLGTANPITIQIKNYSNATLNNVAVAYQLNGGATVAENIASIAPNQLLNFTFSQTADLSAFTNYHFDVWVKYAGDNYPVNDSLIDLNIRNSPIISSYPYLQKFETDDGNFYTGGTNTSWQWGVPAYGNINKAASGSKAWVTNLTGRYNNSETSYLYSPCFDLNGLVQPVLSFSHIFKTELDYDYNWVEYSTDGVLWQKLGNVGSGTNWYDNASLINWNVSKTKWHVASIDLPISATNMRFRFVLSSDAGVTEDGIGIDDVHVFDKAAIYNGIPVTGITQNVSSSNWIHFTLGGNKIVSMNSNGADLGATTVSVYPNIGAVRNSNNQYYANRNIVVRTSNPSGNVSVRFYFTEAEAQSLVNASGCVSCSGILDPYQLGVTQYSGNASDENGLLTDNVTGFFKYIPPANTAIVPYDNGYYAEFNVSSFSEFWLSGGNIQPDANGVCPGDHIFFTAAGMGTSYQWQEDDGTGYHAISNGASFAGTNTATLQLITPPVSFSGYKYRCLIDGVPGNENAVRFTAVWSGIISSDWFVAGNWSCGVVPDQYTDVSIPGGLSVYPVLNAITAIKSINVHPGAAVTVTTGANLQVSGH